MRKICLLVMLSLLTSSLFSQINILDQFKNMKPRNIGPAGMSGRVTAIDVIVSNPDVWYVGAASDGAPAGRADLHGTLMSWVASTD